MDGEYTKDNFYDHCAYNQNNSQDFPCKTASPAEIDSVQLSKKQTKVFEMQSNCGLEVWSGAPVDAREKEGKDCGVYLKFSLES